MEIVREALSSEPLFPFLFSYRNVGKAESAPVNYHFHDWYEIVFVHEGTGTFLIDKELYTMGKRDIFFIKGDVIHKANPSKNFPYVCTVILFHPMLLHSLELGDDLSLLLPFNKGLGGYQVKLEEESKEYEQIIMKMDEETSQRKKGYRHALLLQLHWLLLLINRQDSTIEGTKPMASKSDMWMKDMLIYIDQHFMNKELSISSLAKQSLVTPEHFSRVFKRVTGFNFPYYLGMKRLYKAKSLLLYSNHTISFIADTCGFQSVSYFHYKFRTHFGCTPGKIRKVGER